MIHSFSRIQQLAAGVLLIGVLVPTAGAQGIYRWTDKAGGVHFSDVPPAGQKVERLAIGAPATSQPTSADAVANTAAPNPAAAPNAHGKAVARLLVVSRRSDRPDPSAIHIVGEVGNFGSSTARGVAMVVTALDKKNQKQCVRKQVSVSPPILPPGARGKFEAHIDAPCLSEKSSFDARPVWH